MELRSLAGLIVEWRGRAVAAVLAFAALVVPTTASAQLGPVYVSSVAVQEDGKIVAAGFRDLGEGNLAFAVIRFLKDGTPDEEFGIAGVVTTDFGAGQDTVRALLVQEDGRIVVAGQSDLGDGNSKFALARFNEDGSLDDGFGTGGKLETSFGGLFDRASDVVVQDDGKLVVAGGTDMRGEPDFDIALARYEADGTLDDSFGSDGKITTNIGYAYASSLAIQRDGRIVAAGTLGRLASGRFVLVRFVPDGSPDASFGTDGVVQTFFSPGDYQRAEDVAIQRNGTIIAAGLREGSDLNTDFAVARYTRDGSLDVRFGDGGKVTTDFGDREDIRSIALERDGDLIAGGTQIVRYDRKGSLDASFGSDGSVEGDADSIAIQRDRKILAANGTEIARYNRDGTPDLSFGDGGVAPTG